MERFFGTLKQELGPLRRYTDLAQLHEAIALTIHYYNTKRIHSALNMSPAAYAAGLMLTTDKVFEKKVAWQCPDKSFFKQSLLFEMESG